MTNEFELDNSEPAGSNDGTPALVLSIVKAGVPTMLERLFAMAQR